MKASVVALALMLLVSAPVEAGSWHYTKATWYGPGFYNNRTACGQKLTRPYPNRKPPKPGLIGVAMPVGYGRCGSHVTLRWHHRNYYTKIVDRCGCARGSVIDMTAGLAEKMEGYPPHTINRLRWRFGW